MCNKPFYSYGPFLILSKFLILQITANEILSDFPIAYFSVLTFQSLSNEITKNIIQGNKKNPFLNYPVHFSCLTE